MESLIFSLLAGVLSIGLIVEGTRLFYHADKGRYSFPELLLGTLLTLALCLVVSLAFDSLWQIMIFDSIIIAGSFGFAWACHRIVADRTSPRPTSTVLLTDEPWY